MEVLQVFIAGTALGLSLAMPPGPINALMASESARGEAIQGFLVGLGAMTADTIFLIISYYLGSLFSIEGPVRGVLYIVSAALLAYLAFLTYGSRKRLGRDEAAGRRMRLPYIMGLAIGMTNPLQIAWWLSVGLSLIVSIGPIIIAGFFAGIILWIVAFPLLIRWASGRVPSLYRLVIYASTILLLAFSVWFAFSSFTILVTA